MCVRFRAVSLELHDQEGAGKVGKTWAGPRKANYPDPFGRELENANACIPMLIAVKDQRDVWRGPRRRHRLLGWYQHIQYPIYCCFLVWLSTAF